MKSEYPFKWPPVMPTYDSSGKKVSMSPLQKYYNETPQRDFSIGFKELPIESQEELNEIHRIQVLSARLHMKFNQQEYDQLRECVYSYEKKYGSYELTYYTKESSNYHR